MKNANPFVIYGKIETSPAPQQCVCDTYIINMVKYDMARYKLANGGIVINSAFCNLEWMRVFVCTALVMFGRTATDLCLTFHVCIAFIYYFLFSTFMQRHDPISAITYILLTLAKRNLYKHISC